MVKGIIIQTKYFDRFDLMALRYEGFKGIALILDQFRHPNLFLDGDIKGNYQQETAERMYSFYQIAKSVGFTHFLVDISGGMGKVDGNYWWKVIVDKFYLEKKYHDIIFIIDEAFERIIEQGLYNTKDKVYTLEEFEEYQREVDLYLFARGCKVAWGCTARNADKFDVPIDFISSYSYSQNQKWTPFTKFVLMYGELKIGGSLRYKSLLNKARKLGIEVAYLYQYDSNIKFNTKTPYTWFNSLLQTLGLYNKFCKWMRKRFINS